MNSCRTCGLSSPGRETTHLGSLFFNCSLMLAGTKKLKRKVRKARARSTERVRFGREGSAPTSIAGPLNPCDALPGKGGLGRPGKAAGKAGKMGDLLGLALPLATPERRRLLASASSAIPTKST